MVRRPAAGASRRERTTTITAGSRMLFAGNPAEIADRIGTVVTVVDAGRDELTPRAGSEERRKPR
ncbi:hypothetical protein [Compostimonas suwonensis]|nr:hypothetical protein [Compostimonas suwonensis]